MPRFELARNLLVSARQIDPNDPASVILYGDTSAPVEIREGSTVGVYVNLTAMLDPLGIGLTLDTYLLGANELFNWEPLFLAVGQVAVLFSANAVAQWTATREPVGTRYVRLLYHINSPDWVNFPPPIGTYFRIDASIRTGPEATT